MSNNFVFLNQEFWVPIVVGALLLWFVFAWKERSTNAKKHFWSKLLIALVSTAALAMIALRPALPVTVQKGVGVLLTSGHDASRLDSLRKANKDLIEIEYQTETMARQLDSVNKLFILGHGVPSFDFWRLEGKNATYLGNEPPKGIIHIKYQERLIKGDELQLAGRYKNPSTGNHLLLQGPGGSTLDSIPLNDDAQAFRLSTTLNVTGNYVYWLTEKDSAHTILSKEPVPITVKENKGLNVLMINNFPTFETKYLKNYLAEKGHQVLVRSQLTRGKYKFEYFNRERKPLYRFTQANLEPFDMMLIDAGSYRNLSKKSYDVLMQVVNKDGLGLLIQSDNSFFRLPKSKSHFDFNRTGSSEVRFEKWPRSKFSTYPYAFQGGLLVEPIHLNSSNHITTAYRPYGKGRIGSTTLQNTYQQLLDGHTDTYQELWSSIIEAIGRGETHQVEWHSDNFPVYNYEPYRFQLRTGLEKPKVTKVGDRVISLRQDIDIHSVWSGITYPRTTGWQQLRMENDSLSTYEFFVQDTTAWQALNGHQNHMANKRHFDVAQDAAKGEKLLEAISPFWFFAVFILGMGWLWLEPKLFGG